MPVQNARFRRTASGIHMMVFMTKTTMCAVMQIYLLIPMMEPGQETVMQDSQPTLIIILFIFIVVILMGAVTALVLVLKPKKKKGKFSR